MTTGSIGTRSMAREHNITGQIDTRVSAMGIYHSTMLLTLFLYQQHSNVLTSAKALS